MVGSSSDQRSRWRGLFVAGGAALNVFTVGCPQPADLENPPPGGGPNAVGGAGGSSGSGGGGASGAGGNGPSCETACITTIFTVSAQTQCKICHAASTPAAPALGQLDLSVGFTARLKNVRAKHVDIDAKAYPNPMCPTDDLLINTANPAESWLWKKVNRMAGTCGDPMPAGSPLSAEQLNCVQKYIECVSDNKPLAGTSSGGTAGSGGSGGTAGSSGSGGTAGSSGSGGTVGSSGSGGTVGSSGSGGTAGSSGSGGT